ncbi:ATP-binding protein [Streptomyces sp. NPDC006339]|uniref:ATP-binding protein n=1 Tax=Streptomyces sp. NPDC006339 TaxID=3156755 RepID=UPI0033B76030
MIGARAGVVEDASAAHPSYRANHVARDTAPASARHGVACTLRAWGLEHLADTAELLVSELVTNAVTHTGSRTIGVAVTRPVETTVRIMVLDTDRTEMPPPAAPGADEESGRGLVLVGALSDRWGVERVTTGKRVWCELNVKKVRP